MTQPAGSRRPAVLYVSYDGAAEPLGRSQVVAYLERLAAGSDIALISFEKRGPGRELVARRLAARGIRWIPLSYHRSPPVVSTAWDVVLGVRAIRRELRRRPLDVMHVRSDVPALMALGSGRRSGWSLLYDIRGFWADERVDAGVWPAGGALYRLARRCERWFFAEADAVVTLTRSSLPRLEQLLAGRGIPVEVIPTCVDADRFSGTAPAGGEPRAVWCGSVGGSYRLELGARIASAMGLPLTVLTRDVEAARSELCGAPADVRSVSPDLVPLELRAGDVGLCLIRPSFSKTASAPTRFAEHLAAGMPVAVTPGVGDLEGLVERERVGVTVRDESEAGLEAAGRRLRELAADPVVQRRCRSVARRHFSLDAGVDAYAALYRRLAARR